MVQLFIQAGSISTYKCIEARRKKHSVCFDHTASHRAHLVVSFQDVKVTPSLCVSALLKVCLPLHPESSFLLCFIRVSDKHHCIQHHISSSSLPHLSPSMPNSCPPSSPVFLHCCLHDRITSWPCEAHGLKPQTKH